MLTEEIEGKSLTEVKKLSRDNILDMIGIPLGPVRIKCALLALKVLKTGGPTVSKAGPARKKNKDRKKNPNMSEFYKVAKVSEVPPGTKHLVEVDFVPRATLQCRWRILCHGGRLYTR